MKVLISILIGLLVVGCGKKEEYPETSPKTNATSKIISNSTEKVVVSNEVANVLFDEAMQLIRDGSTAAKPFDTAVRYEKALEKIRKIVKEHPESDIAKKVMSNEKLFIGKSLVQFEDHIKEVHEGDRDHDVTLPTNPSGTTLKGKLRPIVINVRKDGSYIVETKEMKLDQIEQLLKESARENPRQKILFRSDGEAKFKHVAAAISAAKSVGIPEANIAFKFQP